MKKKNLIEEVDLYVESKPLTEEERKEISDYITNYKIKKLLPILSRRTRKDKTKKELV
jgi:hypothetical protein